MSRDLLLNFGTPLYISGMAEATNIDLVCRLTTMIVLKECKIFGKKEAWPTSRDLLVNFETPYIMSKGLGSERGHMTF